MSYIINTLHHFATRSNPIITKKDEIYDHHPIHEFRNPPDPNMVIIFLHDIFWDGEDQHLYKSTWMSSTSPPVCWPETWLGDKYPKAQLLSVHYDAAIRKGGTAGHMDLYTLSENLWQDILPTYKIDCPVFLVGHGFGGLVIKALILEMQATQYRLASKSKESRNHTDWCKLKSFLENVKGILYYATPFLGSKLANSLRNSLFTNHTDWCKLKSFLEIVKSVLYYATPFLGSKLANSSRNSPSSSSLFDDSIVLNTNMCRLNRDFANWRKDHPECHARILLEGLPTTVGSWCGFLVEEGSGRNDVDRIYTDASDHFDVCKPCSRKDIRFTMLTDIIDPIMSTLKSIPLPPIEDNTKSACIEILNGILKQIEEIRGTRNVLIVRIEELTAIRSFEDLERRLQDSLKIARLRKTRVTAQSEQYE